MQRLFSLLALTFASILTLFATAAMAKNITQNATPFSIRTQNYLSLSSVEVTDVTDNDTYANRISKKTSHPESFTQTPISGAIDTADLIVDKIINIGQKIWTVVEKGKPVASYATAKASALPGNCMRWDQLENWQVPHFKTVRVIYKNLYGIEVVRFTYRIVLLYGGRANGVGQYIGYTSVEPVEMSTAYMHTFNVKVSVDAVYNMGTRQNPLAGMILNINLGVETVLKKTAITHTYVLDGNGNITAAGNFTLADKNLF